MKKKFEVGDRVACYHVFEGQSTRSTGKIEEISHGIIIHRNDQDGHAYNAHPKQCRRLFTKKKYGAWHYCHPCQIKRGGVMPKGVSSITATHGQCSMCGKMQSLIPNDDYDWPKKGKKAVWD